MRVFPQISQTATWSARVALLTLQLFVLTIVLHQFAGLATPVAMRLFGLAVFGALVAVALAVIALVLIWQDGSRGSRRALTAMFAAALVLAGPAWSLPKLVLEPGVTEVTTDTSAPPPFRELASVRAEVIRKMQAARANRAPNARTGETLTMKPLRVDRPAEETFSLVRESADALGWTIVSATPPANGEPGYIEAVDRSLLFGITGDVALRVRGQGDSAQVDVRSASRYVEHDLGGNADRVSNLFAEVDTAVARLEKNEEIARLARLRAERAKRIREAREAKARREQGQKQAYDTVSRQWRSPAARRRNRSRSNRRSRQRQRTQELRQFWERMQN